LGIVVIITAIVLNISWLIGVGILLALAAMIVGIIGAQLARPARIKGDMIWLSGSGKEFIASLPPLP
jgi:hypothetical protein